MASLRHGSLSSLTPSPIQRSEAPERPADVRMVAKAMGRNGAHSCERALPLSGEPDLAVSSAKNYDLPEPVEEAVPTLKHWGRHNRGSHALNAGVHSCV